MFVEVTDLINKKGIIFMGRKDVILKRQQYRTRFKNEDMDFTFNW